MVAVYILLIALILFVLCFLIVYGIVFYSPKKLRDKNPLDVLSGEEFEKIRDKAKTLIENLNSSKFEEITITSRDGIKLYARYFHNFDNAPLEIIFHGYRSKSSVDGCGGFKMATDSGHNVLIVDQRAHGKSSGSVITFGIKERYDCLDWVNYCINRFGEDVKILLIGLSMGATTVLMASELIDSKNVVGIIADCGFSSAKNIITKISGDMKLPSKIVYGMAFASAKILGRFDLEETDAVKAVKNSKVPVLLIHGESDTFVPSSMCKEIFDSCTSEKRILTVKDAGHGISYLIDEDSYLKAVNEFKNFVNVA